jgi:hypothetical protein
MMKDVVGLQYAIDNVCQVKAEQLLKAEEFKNNFDPEKWKALKLKVECD